MLKNKNNLTLNKNAYTVRNTTGKWQILSLLQCDYGYLHKKGLFSTPVKKKGAKL